MLDGLFDGLIYTLTTDTTVARSTTIPAAANGLRAALDGSIPNLTPGEATLLDEILVRLADHPRLQRDNAATGASGRPQPTARGRD